MSRKTPRPLSFPVAFPHEQRPVDATSSCFALPSLLRVQVRQEVSRGAQCQAAHQVHPVEAHRVACQA